MPHSSPRPLAIRAGEIALLATAYFLAGRFGLSLAFVHTNATAVWPPTGIALAAVLLLGPRVWPGIFLGAFLVNLVTAGNEVTSLAIALGNTLEAVVGGSLARKFAGGRFAFERTQAVLAYVGLTCLLSTTVSATIGVTTLMLARLASWSSYGSIWLTWWSGDVVSAIIVAPFLIAWLSGKPIRATPGRVAEALGVAFLVWVVGHAAFGDWLTIRNYPLGFLTLPPLVWAALRFGPRGAATAALAVSTFAIHGTLQGFGPFALEEPNESLLLLQAYMGVVTLTALVLAGLIADRDRVEQALRASVREKEVLLKEIHHRVKNNLQVITSLLSLESDQITEPATLELFRDSQNRIKSMAMVHEKLYQAKDISRIHVGGYLRSLVEHLRASYRVGKTVDLVVEADESSLDIDAMIPCALIVNELVANALHHAFPDGRRGTVRVTFGMDAQRRCRLSVGDNGVGLPAGVSLEQPPSLGLRLLVALTSQLDGQVHVERSGGTTFTVQFTAPVPKERVTETETAPGDGPRGL